MEMIQINLLPKEYRRKSGTPSLGRSGFYAIGAVVGLILLIAVITVYQRVQVTRLDQKMEIARFRTEQLQNDIAVVDALIDVKAKIMQRMQAVEQLDRHRTVWVRILEDVSRRVPEFTWLSTIKETDVQTASSGQTTAKGQAKPAGKTEPAVAITDSAATAPAADQMPFRAVSIEGYSFTLNSLANFMINLMKSNFFSDVEMASVEEVQFQKQKAYTYKLTATLHFLSDEELKKLLENESGPDLLASF